MRALLLLFIISLTASAQDYLKHQDIIKSNYLRLNIDGLESWDIHPDIREEKIQEFYNRCQEEIRGRSQAHERDLAALYPHFFSTENYERTHKVLKVRTRFGTQYICRAEIQVSENAEFLFVPEYSEIYVDKINGTLEICRAKIQEIDANALEDQVFTRRAYFEYQRRACNGCPIYPRCQTLKVRIQPKG